MIELELYVRLVVFFDELEAAGRFKGAGEAAFEWFSNQPLERDEREYVLEGVARLMGHWKAAGWEERDRRPSLDRLIWTFHRVWVDRYGWEPTMELGEARRQKWDRRARGE